MMCEQAGPKQLVRDVALAEDAGFDFAVISDHYFPWLDAQGHSPYAWSVLGAAAQATERIPLMTYVTCPIRRYHPAVVAQKAATMQLLSDGRFTLGLGAGENLNEHIVGGQWPIAPLRHEMLEEAVQIIRALWDGDYVTYRGKHFDVEPRKSVGPAGNAAADRDRVSGPASCRLAGKHADAMIAVEPRPELGRMFDEAGGSASRASAKSRLRTTETNRSQSTARHGTVPVVHRRVARQRGAAATRVLRRRIQNGARGRRHQTNAVRTGCRSTRQRHPRVRSRGLHGYCTGPSRRRHPRGVHILGWREMLPALRSGRRRDSANGFESDLQGVSSDRCDDLVCSGRTLLFRRPRPRQDSNLRTRLRRAMLYPLSYEGKGIRW